MMRAAIYARVSTAANQSTRPNGFASWDEFLPEDELLDHEATCFAQDDKQLERLLALGNPPDETAVTP